MASLVVDLVSSSNKMIDFVVDSIFLKMNGMRSIHHNYSNPTYDIFESDSQEEHLSMISFSPNYDQQIVDIIEPLVSSLKREVEMSSHGGVGDENTQNKLFLLNKKNI